LVDVKVCDTSIVMRRRGPDIARSCDIPTSASIDSIAVNAQHGIE
jgi:hypothetical protein